MELKIFLTKTFKNNYFFVNLKYKQYTVYPKQPSPKKGEHSETY